MPNEESNWILITKAIKFSSSILARKTESNLILYKETLKVYPQVKFLGITFHSQLTFKKHFDDILDCCNTRYHHLSLLSNKKRGPSPSTLIQIYRQCVSLPPQTISSAKFNGFITNLFGLTLIYQNTFVLSCFMTPLAFHMWRIDSSYVHPSPYIELHKIR